MPLKVKGYTSPQVKAQRQASLVKALVEVGHQKRAIRAVHGQSEVMNDYKRLGEVEALSPSAGAPPNLPWSGREHWIEQEVDSLTGAVEKYLRKVPPRTAPGPLGSRMEHWAVMKFAPDGLLSAAQVLVRLGLGRAPEEIVDIHAMGELLLTNKPTGGLRPIVLSSICRRIVMGAVARRTPTEVGVACGEDQLGIGAKDGVASAFHTIAAFARSSPDRFVVRLDIEAAHQSFSCSQALAEIVDKCPALSLPYSVWYGKRRRHLWRSSDGRVSYIPSQRSGDQGDAIVQQAFVLVLAPRVKEAIERIKQIDAKAQLLQYADDMQLWIDGTSIDRALAILGEELEKVDLKIAARKTEIWS